MIRTASWQPADRATRLDEQQRRLSGISIRGPYEPGDSLVDKFVNHYENNRLQYVQWNACISREHELLTSSKQDQRLTVQSSGELKVASSHKFEPCDTSSEIMLRYCLIRRGLAMEQANLLAFNLHDKWIEKILACRLEAVPAGFSRTTFQQIEAADKKLFVLLAEKTRAGVQAEPAGRPCDMYFEQCMNSAEVLAFIQPKPVAARAQDEPPSKKAKIDKVPADRSYGKGKSKGKSKQLNFQQFMRTPQELLSLGCVGATSSGQRLCFSYNLKKCSSNSNQRGEKGLRLCAVKGCFKPHPAMDCPSRKQD